MHHLNRRTALTASAVLIGAPSLLSACGGGGSSNGGDPDGDLVIWFPGVNPAEQTFVNEVLIPAYTEASGRGATATFIDWPDMSTRLNAGFSAGTGPDIYGHGPAAVADLVGFGRVEPLDSYLEELDPSDVEDLQAGLDGGVVDEVHYMFPIAATGRQVIYNAAHFTEVGLDPDEPPTTFESLKEAADALAVRDGDELSRAGIVFNTEIAALQQAFASMLWAHGGEMFSEDSTSVLFNSSEGVAALEWYVSLHQGDSPVDNGLGGTWNDLPPAQSPLVTEDTSMIFVDPATTTQILAAAPELDLRIMDALSFEGFEPAAFGGPATGLMINPDSARKDAAWEFFTVFADPDLSSQYAEEVGNVPVRASAIDTEYVKNSPAIASAVKNYDAFRPNPNVAGWTQMRDTLGKYLEQALNAQVSPTEALDMAAAEVETILAKNS
ncbi:ABC transporter substrate-binding protein [Brachybacterium tyrofermentans]|uniref:ABC transporter substrate-binding protein n=2 Tax=Brachybacterium tyrofermentans TaxID=47848 RepID=UPI003FD280A2